MLLPIAILAMGPIVATLIVVIGRRNLGVVASVLIYVVCVAVAIGVAHKAYEHEVTQRILARMDADPVMAAMKESDPESYVKLKDIVVNSEGARPQDREILLKTQSRPIIREALLRHFTHMPDDMVIETVKLGDDVLKARMASNPTACTSQGASYQDLLDQDPGSFARRTVGDARIRNYVVDLLRSQPGPPHPKPSNDEMLSLVMSMMPVIAAKEGRSPQEMAELIQTPEGKCRIIVDTLDIAVSLPTAQGAQAIRTMSEGKLG